MASLFDVFGRLLLEDGGRQFVADAAKAGEAGGAAASQTMGRKLTTGLRGALLSTGVRALGAAAATAFGVATKGAIELENATARYRAETGATAEEAARAGKAINAISGRQRASLEAVTDTAIRVRRDLGAMGEEADELTEDFVRFARVTRQDAAGAVSAFDDILDSWGLTAGDAQGLMDKLIVSQQRWGGSIEDNQRTLAALAPAMRAANMNIDDGIALLGLFGAKGLDAQQASAAFAKALTKVESPEELQRLIDDIANTEDPFERATKAADLFGARAGAKLANALGGANLDDYAISMDEAAGATQRAADILDSTFSAQIQRKISEVGAALRQLGADFGPAVTGAAALASLGGSLGLDRLLAKGFGKLAGSALVRGAAGKAGLVIGAVFSGAMFAADKLSGALSMAFGKMPGSSALRGATSKLGGLMGSGLAAAASVAFAAVLWLEVFNTYNRIKAELAAQNEAISKRTAELVSTATEAELQQMKAVLEKGISDINGVWDAGLFTTDTRRKLEADLEVVNAAIKAKAEGLPVAAAEGIEAGAPAVGDAVDEIFDEAEDTADGRARGGNWGDTGEQVVANLADGIRSKRDLIGSAMDQLVQDLKNALSPAKEQARLIGQLTSKELAKGLKSSDPLVRAQAEYTQKLIMDRLRELVNSGAPLGKKAMSELRAGLRSKNPAIKAQAESVKKLIEGKWGSIRAAAAGKAADKGLASGIRKNRGPVGSAAREVGHVVVGSALSAIAAELRMPVAKLRAMAFAKGGRPKPGEPAIIGEKGPEIWIPDRPGTIVPNRDAAAVASAITTSQATDITVNVHPGNDVSAAAAQRFGRAVADEVATMFRQQNARFVNRRAVARP